MDFQPNDLGAWHWWFLICITTVHMGFWTNQFVNWRSDPSSNIPMERMLIWINSILQPSYDGLSNLKYTMVWCGALNIHVDISEGNQLLDCYSTVQVAVYTYCTVLTIILSISNYYSSRTQNKYSDSLSFFTVHFIDTSIIIKIQSVLVWLLNQDFEEMSYRRMWKNKLFIQKSYRRQTLKTFFF